jgi:hypothetical protein
MEESESQRACLICNLKLLPLLFPTGRQTLCTPASASAGPSVRVPCAVLALRFILLAADWKPDVWP